MKISPATVLMTDISENEIVMREILRLAQEATGLKVNVSDNLANHNSEYRDFEIRIKTGFMVAGYHIHNGDVIMTCDSKVVRTFPMSDPNLFDRISESVKYLRSWGR